MSKRIVKQLIKRVYVTKKKIKINKTDSEKY